ncbi:MAG: FtsW/RodA/SpoVE family cell cycle protein [Clostridia bacterium]|nr:FtsW/RodA/SpoVE family cell cycle protein [Clostridia bacterium]
MSNRENELTGFEFDLLDADNYEDEQLTDEPEKKKKGISFNLTILACYTFVLYMFSVYTNVNRPFIYVAGAIFAVALVTAFLLYRLESRATKMLFTLMFMFVQLGVLIQLILHVEPLGYEPAGMDYFFYLSSAEEDIVIDMISQYAAAFVLSLFSVFVFKTFMKKHATMRFALFLTIFSAVCYIAVILFGTSIGGTRVGIVIGGFAFQPGELLKYVYCIIIGIILSGEGEVMQRRVKLASLVTIMFLMFMVLQGEFGTFQVVALSYFMVVICYMGRKGFIRLVAFVLGLGAAGTGVYFANKFVLKIPFLTNQFDKIFNRFIVWLDPTYDIYGSGYQMHQAMQKIYQAGWFGQYGSRNTIFAAENDLIIVSIIYAFGMITAIAIAVAFILMAVNQLRVISRVDNSRLKIMAAMASAIIFSQVFFNIGGATGVLPLSGITLPFLSKGGSSMVSVSLMMTLVFMLAVAKERGGIIDEEACRYKDAVRADGGGDIAGDSADCGDDL